MAGHGQVQHDGVTRLMGFPGIFLCMWCVREIGEIQWARQLKHVLTATLVVTQIVDDDGQFCFFRQCQFRPQAGCEGESE